MKQHLTNHAYPPPPPPPPPASYSEGASPHEYNAHYIDAYFTPKLLVMADGPEENTAAKFWQMVWDQDCAYIIMLTPLDAHVCVCVCVCVLK